MLREQMSQEGSSQKLKVPRKNAIQQSLKVRQIRNDFFKPTFLPKNERTNSTLLLVDLFSFVFWKKVKTPKIHVEINRPFGKYILDLETLKNGVKFTIYWKFALGVRKFFKKKEKLLAALWRARSEELQLNSPQTLLHRILWWLCLADFQD